MPRKRLLSVLAAIGIGLAATAAAVVPMTIAGAAEACAAPYNNNTVYVGGNRVSHNGHNWTARWWTQYAAPVAVPDGVWTDNGACGGGGGGGGGGGDTCNYPNWAQGAWYATGAIVRFNGSLYIAEHDNPGYDPTISTWFWDPFTCGGGGGTTPPPQPGGFPVSEAQFNQMFPNRIAFYSYAGLVDAARKYPAFLSGDDATKKREAAAFLANVSHESGGLVYVEEQNQANWPLYCRPTPEVGCPAGQSAYHGRGPIQLSWNFNYKAAGDALGLDLLHNPDMVKNVTSVAYQTAVWYWMTQNGPNSMPAHQALFSQGFGGTIRSINGSLECNGGNPAQVQSRVSSYQHFAGILGVDPGPNLYC
ncbi:glycoside hydrolase family 19 protein [Actinoplanes sp. NPDC051633]|uniref:glycoside hydrolase family 19 protein n=1 Tax=Actinoplanes sp. NPDC051633 TaxID=3155670 RepID=UPI003413B6FF